MFSLCNSFRSWFFSARLFSEMCALWQDVWVFTSLHHREVCDPSLELWVFFCHWLFGGVAFAQSKVCCVSHRFAFNLSTNWTVHPALHSHESGLLQLRNMSCIIFERNFILLLSRGIQIKSLKVRLLWEILIALYPQNSVSPTACLSSYSKHLIRHIECLGMR